MERNQISLDEIRNMTEEQWQAYRVASWKKKAEVYSAPTPADWYLNDREKFAAFIERQQSRRNNRR
jgi:hypothetical protein